MPISSLKGHTVFNDVMKRKIFSLKIDQHLETPVIVTRMEAHIVLDPWPFILFCVFSGAKACAE